jgi:hypothetical protein
MTMMESISIMIGVFLVIIGLVEVFRMISFLFLRTKGENDIMIIVPVSGHNEEAELLLRSAAARVKWTGGMSQQRVVCLDCGMDEETKEVCDTISQDYSFMEVRGLTEFESLFGRQTPRVQE